ncbi:unnamed protein product [Sphagnum troendelagicum]
MDLAVFLHADILVVLAILTGLLQTAKLLRCLLLLIRECRAARRDASRSRGLAIAESFTNVLRAVLAMQGNAQGDDAGDQGSELQEIIVHDTSDSAN